MWGDKHFPHGFTCLDAIEYLFNSEQDGIKLRGRAADYRKVHKLIVAGDILIQEESITCCLPPQVLAKNKISGPGAKVFRKSKLGGGHLHGWLKYWAYHWLLDLYGLHPELEAILPGYGRADIFCSRPRVIVECGNTSPGHAMTALHEGFADSFVVIPFQRVMLANIGVPKPCHKLKGFRLVAQLDPQHDSRHS